VTPRDQQATAGEQQTESAEPPEKTPGLAASSTLFILSYTFGNLGYFAAVLLLARWFPPNDRAIIAFSTLAVLMLVRVSHLGLPEAVSVFAASERNLRSTLLTNQLLFAATTSSIIGACFVGALRLSGSHPAGVDSETMYVILGGTISYALYDSVGSYLIATGRSVVFALTYPFEGWGWLTAIVAIREFGRLDPGAVVFAWVIAFNCGFLIRLIVAIRVSGLAKPSLVHLKRGVRFGFPAWVGGLSSFASFRLDQVLMGFISTRTQLGLYAVAVNCSEVLLYVASGTSMAITPVMARSDPKIIASRALHACRTVSLITIGSTIVGLALGPYVLPLVFGANYQGSVTSFLVLAAGAVGWTTSVVLSSALLGAGASRLSSIGSFTALLVGVALDIALIPSMGSLGASLATTGGFLFAGLTTAIVFQRRFGTSSREFIPDKDDVAALRASARSALATARRRIALRTAR
jgi:O-antigen/teichoic acid export membrane protein